MQQVIKLTLKINSVHNRNKKQLQNVMEERIPFMILKKECQGKT